MALKSRKKNGNQDNTQETKKAKAGRRAAAPKFLARRKDKNEADAAADPGIVFSAATADTPPSYETAFMNEGDGFVAGVRSADPVLTLNDPASASSWKSQIVPVAAGSFLLLAVMSLFCMATDYYEIIPFLIPGALVFAGLSILGSVKPGKAKWIASGVIAVLLVASMAVFHSAIGGGLADLINQFYDVCEEAQAYVYKRVPGGDGDPRLGAVWISCLLGLLAALPPAAARKALYYGITMAAMFAFAYYGLVPSWICIAVMLAALFTGLSGSNALSSLPLLLAVMLVFGAVVVIDPGENYGISVMDEDFRDRFALNSLLIQGDEMTSEDLSGLEDLGGEGSYDDTGEDSSENDIAGYAGIIIAVLAAGAIAAAVYLLWSRLNKRRKALRAGIDSRDPRTAVTAMFPYSVRWLKAGGVDVTTSIFSELTPAVASQFSQDYANRFREMYLLWREAAYSDHPIEETSRTDMESFLRDTTAMVKDKLTFTERISALVRYAL